MSIFREIIGVLIILSILWSSGPGQRIRSMVWIMRWMDPMSGTGFPFSLPAAIHLLFHVCNHLRFYSTSESGSVAVGCWHHITRKGVLVSSIR